MDQELLLIPALYSGVQRHAVAGAGQGQGRDQDGEKKNTQVNLHAVAAISGSTVMWAACPNYGTLYWE